MGDFSLQFTENGLSFPPGVTITPKMISFTDRGGCDSAEATVTGDIESLGGLIAFLGKELRIRNTLGEPVWWGILDEVTISAGAWGFGASLSRMANRVQVRYTARNAQGALESLETDWADNLSSQAKFGIREVMRRIGDANETFADKQRDLLLAKQGWPRPHRTSGQSGQVSATLKLKGHWQYLSWRIYENLAGRMENSGDGEDHMVLGWKLASSARVGWRDNAMHDVNGRFAALRKGDRINVTGSASNNGVRDILASPSEDLAQLYTSSTVVFEASDDIKDASGGMSFAEAQNYVEVSGSAGNSGYHYIDGVLDSGKHLTTSGTTIVAEAAGPSVSIRFGHSVRVTGSVTTEAPGVASSVNIQQYGEYMAQSFTPAVDMTIGEIAVTVAVHGSPVDDLEISICSNSGGAPGSALATAYIDPTDLEVDKPREQWVSIPAALSAGTKYWIRFRRSAATSTDNWFIVGLIHKDMDDTLAWTGAAWVTLESFKVSDIGGYYSIPYQIYDAEDTKSTITRIVTAAGQGFISALTMATTGISVNQWIENGATALVEIERLLDAGTAAGERLTAYVDQLRKLVVAPEPAAPTSDVDLPVVATDEALYSSDGVPWNPGRNPTGRYWRLGGAPKWGGLNWQLSPDYVQAATYDIARARWRIAFRDSIEDVGLL